MNLTQEYRITVARGPKTMVAEIVEPAGLFSPKPSVHIAYVEGDGWDVPQAIAAALRAAADQLERTA